MSLNFFVVVIDPSVSIGHQEREGYPCTGSKLESRPSYSSQSRQRYLSKQGKRGIKYTCGYVVSARNAEPVNGVGWTIVTKEENKNKIMQ